MRGPYEVQHRILCRLIETYYSQLIFMVFQGDPKDKVIKELCYEQWILRMPGRAYIASYWKEMYNEKLFLRAKQKYWTETRFCCDFMRRKVDLCLCMDAINPVEKSTSLRSVVDRNDVSLKTRAQPIDPVNPKRNIAVSQNV